MASLGDSKIFSSETLDAGIAALGHQEVKAEDVEDYEAIQRELQDA